jgi:hypothetical protein
MFIPCAPRTITAVMRARPQRDIIVANVTITAPRVGKDFVNLRPQRQARIVGQTRALRRCWTVLQDDKA